MDISSHVIVLDEGLGGLVGVEVVNVYTTSNKTLHNSYY